MSDLWGVPDKWATSINGSDELAMAHTAAQISNLGAQTQHLGAQTDLTQTEADQKKLYLSLMQARLPEMMARGPIDQNDPDAIQQYLLRAADDSYMMGQPHQAAQTIASLGQYQWHQANVANTQSRIAEVAAMNKMKKAQAIHEIYSNATDEQSFNAAKMITQGMFPDEQIPAELQNWDPNTSPAILDQLHVSTRNGWKQAQDEWHATQEEGRNNRNDARIESREVISAAQEVARNGRTAARLAANANKVKAAGTRPMGPGTPDAMMTRAADALVHRDFPDLPGEIPMGKDLITSAGYDVASEARALMNKNPGLSSTEAIGRVYQTYKQAGAFGENIQKGLFKDTKSNTYRKPTNDPQPMPASADKLVDGAIYSGPKGVFKWDAKTKTGIVVPGGAGVPGADAAVRSGR